MAGSSSINFARILAADTAGHQFHKAHEYSCWALGAATPLAIISKKDGFTQRIADLAFALAIPLHMHMGMNSVVTDYLPRAARGPVRVGVLGMTSLTLLGLLHLNTFGAGVTQTVKGLWRSK